MLDRLSSYKLLQACHQLLAWETELILLYFVNMQWLKHLVLWPLYTNMKWLSWYTYTRKYQHIHRKVWRRRKNHTEPSYCQSRQDILVLSLPCIIMLFYVPIKEKERILLILFVIYDCYHHYNYYYCSCKILLKKKKEKKERSLYANRILTSVAFWTISEKCTINHHRPVQWMLLFL